MAKAPISPTAQRAYTLRLRGVDRNDQSWRFSLWATHEAVNRGAKVFGEWLLTLRGGLDHKLAEVGPPEQRKDRRILLALSWLSVEDAHGAPREESLIVAQGTESTDCRSRKLWDALTEILRARNVPDSELGNPQQSLEHQSNTWLSDCAPSLSAAIREDAVWVNRSVAFDRAVQQCPSLTRDEIWDFLEPFFNKPTAYLKPQVTDADELVSQFDSVNQEKAKDLVQKAGGWLSKRMGSGSGADFTKMAAAYEAITSWAASTTTDVSGSEMLASLADHLSLFSPSSRDMRGVLSVISGPGYKSATRNYIYSLNGSHSVSRGDLTKLAELSSKDAATSKSKVGGKGQRPYATLILQQVESACGFTYLLPGSAARHGEFSVMLDHAARRVNVVHSWIKNAEAERRQFENDAQRLAKVPPAALEWLQHYCRQRASSSGSLEEYRIRRRAIDGWDKVLSRWSHSDCQSAEDRIAAARMLQADPEIDKFGDIQLFESLATEDAMCVWSSSGAISPQPLKDFVAASEAIAKRNRFKVPAYRHPDSLRHPVFTDFGESRWCIDFSAHRAPAKMKELLTKVEKLTSDLAKAEQQLESATTAKRSKFEAKIEEGRSKLDQVGKELAKLKDHYRHELKLWNGQAVKATPLRWSCKRLTSDLALSSLNDAPHDNPTAVPRADRLGRAAADVNENGNVTVAGLFERENWNGRLQAPRAQLDAIANYVDKYGWDAKACKMRDRIRWLISFSAQLTQIGPWPTYCDRFTHDAPAKPFVSSKGEYAVKHVSNDQRKGQAKLLLSRLPSLRVLSVDLGHRYAAACAVWETLTRGQMDEACTAARVSPPSAGMMYLHLKGTNSCGKSTTTIYRRIGLDSLPDGSPHPAPWARLDRQFLIKLQGEDRSARKASPSEIMAVESFEQWAGRTRGIADPRPSAAVDALMNDAVRTARLAVARHGRRARIAHHLISDLRTIPGARQVALDTEGRINVLVNMLADWHSLATDVRWNDELARQLWNQRIAKLTCGFEIQQPALAEMDVEQSRPMRRQAEAVLSQQLNPLAVLLAGDANLRQQLHDAWSSRWMTDDEEWLSKLKWLSRWLMPRGGSRRDAGRRKVGGLSLTRISTLTEYRRKVQVGFFTRLRPDGTKKELGRSFGQSTLDAIQRLKDQRIKQLASRIVEAALGVGYEKHAASGRDLPRLRSNSRILRFAPCHAVVIEDLSHYRPEETRKRRENRATMDWKSAETRKRLADHCQLYGLHLRDVNPQYTSRQDSRTGAPGMRCIDVTVSDFLTKPWWRKHVARAQKKANDNGGDAFTRYLLALEAKWAIASDLEKSNAKPLRIPVAGGEIFISADKRSPLSQGIQADLNAAANIGLRALMDPDFPGKWWYVPCDPKSRKPHPDKVKGGILDEVGPLQVASSSIAITPKREAGAKKTTAPKDVINLWRNPMSTTISGVAGDEMWQETPMYWNFAKVRVIEVLRRHSGLPTE
jgi:IS605 OrfB family transposase